MGRITLSVFLFLAGMALAAEPDANIKQEIVHLFDYLENSGCAFNRNGTWYGAKEAAAHLQTKYEYLLRKGLVSTAEDFVDRAASESSVSGKPYLVRCAANRPTESGPWFKEELARYRKSGRR